MHASQMSIVALLAIQVVAERPAGSVRLAVVTPTAGAEQAWSEHEDASSLIQLPVSPPSKTAPELLEEAEVVQTKATKARDPNPAKWFGDFSEGESTYAFDGTLAGRDANPELNVLDGWDPHQANLNSGGVEAAKWFQETASGGSNGAWQTSYPAEQENIAGQQVKTGKWFTGTGSEVQQDYVEPVSLASEHQSIPASWFDSNIQQLDGFGREKLAGIGSPRNYLDWQERSVNTSLTCKAPGCTANVSLLAPFDSSKEIFKNCRFSIFFHPTDFDDEYSGEKVEWVQINNREVSANCRPFASGGNKTAQRALIPCVNDVSIDHIMPKNGDLKIAAKIPKVVDENDYNGNLLSAVPMVTCLVSPKPTIAAPAPPKRVFALMSDNTTCVTSMPLQCATRGCASEISIPINASCQRLGQCLLSINVTQTDYDGTEGSTELIEYIKVEGKEVASKLKPGKNPCQAKWKGTALLEKDMSFVALANHKVNVSSGKVLIEGKISEFVDECASNGYLFDAVAQVTCGAPAAAKKAVLLSQKTLAVPAEAHRSKLKVKSA